MAIGIIVKCGNGGGTYAHRDIAFEFASWLSSEFKLYLVTEIMRRLSSCLIYSQYRKLQCNFNRTERTARGKIETTEQHGKIAIARVGTEQF